MGYNPGMLVSAFTIQIWLDWDKVPVDVRVCTDEQHVERRDGDIIMFTPRVTELQDNCKDLVDLFQPNYTFSHTMKHGTIFIKRGSPRDEAMPEVTEVEDVIVKDKTTHPFVMYSDGKGNVEVAGVPDSEKSLSQIIKEQRGNG